MSTHHVIARWWRRQPGTFVCLATKVLDHAPVNYFFRRGEVDIAGFIADHADKNVYFVPHLFDSSRRNKESAVAPQGLWADLDRVDPRTLGDVTPTIAIKSSRGRYVGLWETNRAVDEELNRRLTYFIGADRGGWDLGQLLRCPDSCNYKYRPPQRTVCLWDDGPRYRVAHLQRILPRLPQRLSAFGDTAIEPLDEEWRSIVRRYGCAHLIARVTDKVLKGWRSDVCCRITADLHDAGASEAEALTVLLHARCAREKWNPDLIAADVARIYAKLGGERP